MKIPLILVKMLEFVPYLMKMPLKSDDIQAFFGEAKPAVTGGTALDTAPVNPALSIDARGFDLLALRRFTRQSRKS